MGRIGRSSPARTADLETLGAPVKPDVKKWWRIVKELGIKPEQARDRA
jgi:hypothetical protein